MKKANKLGVAFVGFIVLIIIGISSCGGSATPSGDTSSIDSGSPVGSSIVTTSAQASPPQTTTAPAQASPPPTTTAPATTAPPPPPPSPTSALAAAPTTSSGCYPLTNGGNCYEPGEYCRKSDHGASGVAGDGKHIVCENNNGWRWEPV